jgi:hypothetical protein
MRIFSGSQFEKSMSGNTSFSSRIIDEWGDVAPLQRRQAGTLEATEGFSEGNTV